MIKIQKKKKIEKNEIFFKSSLGNINIFFIDNIFNIQKNINLKIKNNNIYFYNNLGKLKLELIKEILFIYNNNKLYLIVKKINKKKNILNLYNKLIKIKLKGIIKGFKLNLILQGIGFKASINNNFLILKLGFSHEINILIPSNIKIIIQSNNLIFSSLDYIKLTQFVNFIKNHKKPEPYKGKGIIFKDEKIFKKEGKKK